MEGTAQITVARTLTTDLTNAYVYDQALITAPNLGQFNIASYNSHDIMICYDPDEASTCYLELTIDESPDDIEITSAATDAAFKWFPVCAESSSAGVRTLTPDTAKIVSVAAAKMYRTWRDVRTTGKKMRIGVRETSVSADFGNAQVIVCSRAL